MIKTISECPLVQEEVMFDRIKSATAALVVKRQNWRARRQQMRELAGCDEFLARELGFTTEELKLLARRGPGAADLLQRRLDALHMDAKTISAAEAEATRDMQRCCSICEAKRRCRRDLDTANDSHWRDYCLNAQTLAILESRRTR